MVEFEPATHTYTLDGRVLPSVTQVLKAVGLAPDYGNVPEAVLAKKASRGTLVHAEIQAFVESGEIGFSDEFGDFVREFGKRGTNPRSETLVTDGRFAGTVDRIYDSDAKVIADYKTTATLHRESVSWQLSVYAYLSGEDFGRAEAWWFSKEGLKVVEVPLRPKEEVAAMLDAYLRGDKYLPVCPIPESEMVDLEATERAIAELKARMDAYEARKREILSQLAEAMEGAGIPSYEGKGIRITYVAPCDKRTVDAKRLKEEMPEIYDAYARTTRQKASVRITLKGDIK